MTPSYELVEYMKWWEAGPAHGGKPALVAYRCSAGKPTIGWGHTRGVRMGMTCTIAEAEQWLREDLSSHSEGVVATFPGIDLVQHQWDGLFSFAYNVGIPAFRGSSICVMIRQGLFARVGPCMDLWNKVTKKTVEGVPVLVVEEGLVKRRAGDRKIFEAGDYSARP